MKKQRPLGPTLFATLIFAAIAAGCAGGMGGSLPTQPGQGGQSSSPAKRHKPIGAVMRIHIPPKPKHRRRGAKYVSPYMQSLTVGDQLVETSPSPWPSLAPQTFVVATPQPCSTASDGGLTCTFAVNAYVGNNIFTFNQYASKNPSPQDTPLATLTTGVTKVTAGSPLSFAMQGVVATVVISVPNPEVPHDPVAGNTEPIPIGSPTSFPLAVTAQDPAGNNIATDTFASPITISVSPANAGVTLAIASPCAGDKQTATSVTVTCAADLGNLTAVYDGTATSAGTLSYVDKATISASPQPATATPVPASVALTSNAISYQIVAPTGNTNVYLSNLALNPVSGKFVFGVSYSGSNPALVEFDPSAPTSAVSSSIGFEIDTAFVDSSGNIWTDDSTTNAMHCFTSVSATPATLTLTDSSTSPVYEPYITQDVSGNIWYAGESEPGGEGSSYPSSGFTPASCSSGSLVAQYSLQSYNSYFYGIAPAKPGNVPGVLLPVFYEANLYALTTAVPTPPAPSPSPLAAWPSGQTAESMVGDPSFNAYAGSTTSSGYSVVNEIASGSSTIQTLLQLPPESNAYGISQYSGTQAASQAVMVQDDEFAAGALVKPVAATTEPLELPAPYAFGGCPTAFDKNGGAWAICERIDGSVWATHTIVTSNWGVTTSGILAESGYPDQIIAVPELGANNAPFTVTSNSNPSAIAIGTPWPSTPSFAHEIPIEVTNATGSSTLTIQDKNGRTQTLTINVVSGGQPDARRHHRRGRRGRPR